MQVLKLDRLTFYLYELKKINMALELRSECFTLFSLPQVDTPCCQKLEMPSGASFSVAFINLTATLPQFAFF